MPQTSFWRGTAIVTASGSEIGRALINSFFSEGMAIVALDADASSAEASARGIRDKGGKAIGIGVDLLDRAMAANVAKFIAKDISDCSVLCANIGFTKLEDHVEKLRNNLNFELDTHSVQLINLVAEFLPLLRSTTGNRRILITAAPGSETNANHDAKQRNGKYNLTGLGETLRLALQTDDIGLSIYFPKDPDPFSYSEILATHAHAHGSAQKPSMNSPTTAENHLSGDTIRQASKDSERLLAGLKRNEEYIFSS